MEQSVGGMCLDIYTWTVAVITTAQESAYGALDKGNDVECHILNGMRTLSTGSECGCGSRYDDFS